MADIEYRNVKKVFDDDTVALQDFSLQVKDGEFVVIVGPSGCGKSTALRMLAGLESITDGEILIGGEVVNEQTPQERNIAMVFQNYALYPHKTVRANMDFPLRMMGLEKEERKKRIEKTAEILGITEYLNRKPKNLSGGQRQRASMGRALVRDPKVSLLDEPLSNLDAKLRVEIRAEMADLQEEIGITTVYVTHDQVEAMTLGDRVAVLSRGRLQQCDTPQRIYDHPANIFVATFIGSPRMNLFTSTLKQDEGGLAFTFGDRTLPFSLERFRDHADSLRDHHNEDVLVGFRPEAFCPAGEAESSCRIKGTVQNAEALGHELIVYFDTEVDIHLPPELQPREQNDSRRSKQERAFVARLPAGAPPASGEEIELGLRTDELYLFTQDGNALNGS